MILTYEDDFSDADDWTDYSDNDSYDDAIGKSFCADITDILNDLIDESDIIKEDFTSERNMRNHFEKHCLGHSRNKHSTRQNVYYAFNDNSKYCDYEKFISNRFADADVIFGSLYAYDDIIKALKKLFIGNYLIRFGTGCGLRSGGIPVSLSIYAFSSNVTENYQGGNTVDICIKNGGGKTITLYAVDANYLQNKFNNLIKKYCVYTDITDFEFNN